MINLVLQQIHQLASRIGFTALSLCAIAFLVFSANIIDIFYIKTLYVDDHERLILGLENRIHQTIFDRNMLRAYVIYPLYELLSWSPHYARFAQVVLFCIPLSFSVFLMLRKFANSSKVEAIAVAVLPFALPGQWMIPNFIDGSYTVQGMLVFNLSLFAALHYVTTSSVIRVRSLILVGALYGASLEMMDQSVFLMPVAVLCLLATYFKEKKLGPILCTALIFILLGIGKAIHAYIFPTVSASTTIDPSLDVFLRRFAHMTLTVFPFTHTPAGDSLNHETIAYIFALLTGAGLALGRWHDRFVISIGLSLAFCASIVFITVSKYYSARYVHIASFGFAIVMVQSIAVLLHQVLRQGKLFQLTLGLLFGSMIVYGGYVRALKLIDFHKSPNFVHMGIVEELKYHGFPKDSQLAIIEGGRIQIGGWWHYARGYIKYATGRPDLNGIVGRLQNFYDPFEPGSQGFVPAHRMKGLTIDKKTFFFELKACHPAGCDFFQYEYVLRFMGPEWHLLKFNKYTGDHVVVQSGNGKENFYQSLSTLGIDKGHVLFAD